MSEHDEQSALFELIGYQANSYPQLEWLHAIPNGGQRHPAVAAKLSREGVKSGVWDVFLPFPVGQYHGLYLEMKFGKNKLTENQKKFRGVIEPLGYKFCVAWTAEEAYNQIMNYLEGKE